MNAKTDFRIKDIKKPVSIKYRNTSKIVAHEYGWLLKGRGQEVLIRVALSETWPEDAKMVIDTTQFKGPCEVSVNHQLQDDEHVLIVTSLINNEKKESMLRLRDIPVIHVDIDERAKIQFKAEVNGIQFIVSPSREETIAFNADENELNFFNGFRKIHVDLAKKLHVELNADQIIDDIRI